MRSLIGPLLVAFTLYALVDWARTPDTQMRSLPKGLWLVCILLIPIAGPVAWLVAGDVRHTKGGPEDPPST